MGVKDWFGGDRAKQFSAKAKETVKRGKVAPATAKARGKLTAAQAAELAKQQKRTRRR
jgi:hypothetical protein